MGAFCLRSKGPYVPDGSPHPFSPPLSPPLVTEIIGRDLSDFPEPPCEGRGS